MEAGKNKASFQVMAGNKAGNQLYDNLTGYARDSIYGNEVYGDAQTMLGFGIGSDKVMDDMKMLGDIAMGSSEKLGSPYPGVFTDPKRRQASGPRLVAAHQCRL